MHISLSSDRDDSPGEVIRIEKTLELASEIEKQSEDEDEDDLTLSLHRPLVESVAAPATTAVKAELKRKRSFSETSSDQTNGRQPPRSSRQLARAGAARSKINGFEVTQSVDRATRDRSPPVTRDRSPVFFLDPVDWIRTEGSSPLPPTAATGLAAGAANQSSSLKSSTPSSLSVLSESSEDAALSASLSTLPPPARNNLLRSKSVTPTRSRLLSCSRSRSMTPAAGGGEDDRQRKVAIPILCRRNAMMVGVDSRGRVIDF